MLASDVNEIYSLYSPYSSYQYCGGAPTWQSAGLVWQDAVSVLHSPSSSPRGNVCASAPTISSVSCFSFPVYVYIARRLIQLKWSSNPIENTLSFMRIIKRVGSWEAEGIWAFLGESSGILECWGSWIRFHGLVSFYGFQWLQFWSVTTYSKKLWGPVVSSEFLLTEFSCEWVYVWIYIYTPTCLND